MDHEQQLVAAFRAMDEKTRTEVLKIMEALAQRFPKDFSQPS